MKLVLIGFMGCGKSTAAKGLSEQLTLPRYEMDELIVVESGYADIPAIFAAEGEVGFRSRESDVAKQLGALSEGIVSTGGGVVMRSSNMDALRQHNGRVVWLQAPFASLVERLQGDTSRPLFADVDAAHMLFTKRLPLYRDAADHIVDTTGLAPSEVVAQIVSLVCGQGKGEN